MNYGELGHLYNLTNLTKGQQIRDQSKGSSYLEGKGLSIPRGPQIWVPDVSHAIYVGLQVAIKVTSFICYLI